MNKKLLILFFCAASASFCIGKPALAQSDADEARLQTMQREADDDAVKRGQKAQAMGRLYVAREMFHMVVITFPQPCYQYYATQARLGLEQLDAASRATL